VGLGVAKGHCAGYISVCPDDVVVCVSVFTVGLLFIFAFTLPVLFPGLRCTIIMLDMC